MIDNSDHVSETGVRLALYKQGINLHWEHISQVLPLDIVNDITDLSTLRYTTNKQTSSAPVISLSTEMYISVRLVHSVIMEHMPLTC